MTCRRWQTCLVLWLVVAARAETFLVAVGVEKYDDSRISSLKYAVADAQSVAAAFRASGVAREHVTLLTSDATQPLLRPTRIALVTALQAVKQKARQGDRLIFFFAGHGVEEDGEQYLLTVDTRRDLVDATALPMDLINRALKGLQASDVLFIVDACRNAPDAARGDEGAQLTEGLVRGVQPLIETSEQQARPELLATLLSCDVGQRAYEDPESGHGVFTTYLLKGLAGEAAAQNGPVELRRLADYVTKEVSDWAKRSNKQQTPRLLLEGDGDMVLLTPPPEPLVSVSFQRQPLSAVVELIAEQYGAQVVLGKGVDPTKTVSGRLENQPLGTALKVLLLAAELQVRREGKIYIIEGADGGPTPLEPPEPEAEPEPTRPVLIPQTGHGWSVQGLRYTPDGQWLVSCGAGQMILWHADSLAVMGCYLTESGFPGQFAISPDGQTVAGVSKDDWWVWDIGGGQPVAQRRPSEPASGFTCVAFEPGGERLLIGNSRGELTSWDIRSGRLHATVETAVGPVTQLQFSPDGKLLATAHRDGTILLGQTETLATRTKLAGHTHPVESLAFSPDGRFLASATHSEPAARTWDVGTGQPVRTLEVEQGASAVSFSQDGKTLAVGDRKGPLHVFECDTGEQPIPPLPAPFYGDPAALDYAPDGGKLAVAYSGGQLLVLDSATGRELSRVEQRVRSVWGVSFSKDGQRLAGSRTGPGSYWDLAQPALRKCEASRPLSGYPPVTFGADAEHVVFASYDRVWMVDLQNDSVVWEHRQKSEHFERLAVDAAGTKLAALSVQTGSVWIWDAATGNELLSIPGTYPFRCLALSPDGRWLATGAPADPARDGRVAVFDTTNGRLVVKTEQAAICAAGLAFSPDSLSLLSASTAERQPLRLMEVASGRTLAVWGDDSSSATAASFSPDGRQFAVSTGYEHNGTIWDADSRRLLHHLDAHQGGLNQFAYDRTGKRLATAGRDGSVALWHAETGRLLAKLWALDDGDDWLITTPQGFYDGSPLGLDLARFEVDGKLQPVGALAEEFHRPELVQRALAGELLD